MGLNLSMVLKLFAVAMVPVVLSAVTYLVKRKTRFEKLPEAMKQILIGILFGGAAMLATELGVDIGGATANARDAAPLCAGLLFGGPAGIIAGLIGGIGRWVAVSWGASEYSALACTIATSFAGVFAAFLRRWVFDRKRPTFLVAFVTGGVMEVIHMTILFLTHYKDPIRAYEIVKICTIPMILCNGVAVMLAVIVVAMLSRGIHWKEHRRRTITQLFQTPILIAIAIAFLLSTGFVFLLQSYSSQENATTLMKINIADTQDEIRRASDRHLLSITHSIAEEIEADPDVSLKAMADKYKVADVWRINEQGRVEDATDGNIGFDMASDAYKPEEERQSSRFLVLLEDGVDEYVQEYGALAANPNEKRKLAGVSLKTGGFVQAGYDASMFQSDIEEQIRNNTKNHRIGENGRIVIVDHEMNIISDTEGIQPEYLAQSDLELDESTVYDKPFREKINGTDCMCMITETEGFLIFAVMPMSEVFSERDTLVYVNSFMEILIYAALFTMIAMIIRKAIVKNLHRVNDDLAAITDGELDTRVDVYSSEEFALLSDDINSAVTTLKEYISEAASRIDKELAFAKSIQHAALPSVFPPYPERRDFSVYATMDTAKEVGGDFYDFYLLDDRHFVILIADVSGKGIPAAMFMMTAKTMIKSLAETGVPVNEVFTRANEELCAGNDAGMFVTAWMGVVNTENGHIDYVNAGHNPPVIKHGDGSFTYLKSKAGFVLAGMDGVHYKKQETDLLPGDRILLYTDGVTEATREGGELFGEDRLLEYVNAHAADPTEDVLTGIKGAIDAFVGEAEQFDDITMLLFDYYGEKGVNAMTYQEFPASDESLESAMEFVNSHLEEDGASPKTVMQVSVAFEEMFVNVAHYAYPDAPGNVSVGYKRDGEFALIEIKDSGTPFNPFAKEDPDITLPAEERKIGGLGILITRKIMDGLDYEYRNGYNIVTMKKKL